MPKRVESLLIVDNKHISSDFFILEIESSTVLPVLMPGQFVQVKVENSPGTFLRRPISIYDVNIQNSRISLLIQIVGNGTLALSKLKVGEYLDLVYPLGNSFSMPETGEKSILIGGGVGIAPMLFMSKVLKEKGLVVDMLFGFRSAERMTDLEDFRKNGTVYITTEDGSFGEKGYVTDHSIFNDFKYNRIYCCGPDPMMKAVAAWAGSKDVFCEVSLENLMGCGFGACLCCTVSTTKGNLNSCTDGPVFNIKDLKW